MSDLSFSLISIFISQNYFHQDACFHTEKIQMFYLSEYRSILYQYMIKETRSLSLFTFSLIDTHL